MPDGVREYSMEIVDRAEELFCVDGLTYERTVEALKTFGHVVGISTLKRWGIKYGWTQKRDDIREALSEIRVNTIKARAKALDQFIKDLDPMQGFAVAKLEELALKTREFALKEQAATPPQQADLRPIESREDIIAAFQEAIELKLAWMVRDPEQVDFRAIRNLKEAQDYINELQPKTGAELCGLTPETADEIRRKILFGES